jgi:precorrin-2 dehydrogenase/sirohydrochlorin ferrochelatase
MPGAHPGLPITLTVVGQSVLLIGDGEPAARKLLLLRHAGAIVEQVNPAQFREELLIGARVVMVTAADPTLMVKIFESARMHRVWCWCSDAPEYSDFAMPAVAELGAARIAISTGGGAPALAGRLRGLFESAFGERFARFVDALAERRSELRHAEPDAQRRRTLLIDALDGFALELRVRYPEWFR